MEWREAEGSLYRSPHLSYFKHRALLLGSGKDL